MKLTTTTRTTCILGLLAALSGCTTVPSFSNNEYVAPLDGAQVNDNKTRYSRALECLNPLLPHGQGVAKRFAVGKVSDFTGKEDLTNGRRITQGASLMVMSALSRAGVPLVERFDTSIADMELKYSDNKLITDTPETGNHRRIMSGTIPGSDYHVVGGVTEVNYNIKSGSLESSIRFFGFGARYFVMDVGLDLRLVNTKTLEVINTQSLQKQIIGTELSGGYFRVFSDGVADITSSERTQEPIQRAVRMVIEQAVYNMLVDAHNIDSSLCDSVSSRDYQATNSQQPAPVAPQRRTSAPAPTVAPAQSASAANTEATRVPVELGKRPNPNSQVRPIPPQQANGTNLNPANAGSKGVTQAQTTTPATTPQAHASQTNTARALNQTGASTQTASASQVVVMSKDNKQDLESSTEPEASAFSGLVGTSNTTAPGSSDDRMKEKMLWGNRPIIR